MVECRKADGDLSSGAALDPIAVLGFKNGLMGCESSIPSSSSRIRSSRLLGFHSTELSCISARPQRGRDRNSSRILPVRRHRTGSPGVSAESSWPCDGGLRSLLHCVADGGSGHLRAGRGGDWRAILSARCAVWTPTRHTELASVGPGPRFLSVDRLIGLGTLIWRKSRD